MSAARMEHAVLSPAIERILNPPPRPLIANCWQCGSHFPQGTPRETHCPVCVGWRSRLIFLALLQEMQL